MPRRGKHYENGERLPISGAEEPARQARFVL